MNNSDTIAMEVLDELDQLAVGDSCGFPVDHIRKGFSKGFEDYSRMIIRLRQDKAFKHRARGWDLAIWMDYDTAHVVFEKQRRNRTNY